MQARASQYRFDTFTLADITASFKAIQPLKFNQELRLGADAGDGGAGVCLVRLFALRVRVYLYPVFA
jgi:hypothetical protein